MKRLVYIMFLLFGCGLQAAAQNNYLSLQVGPSFPVGDFGSVSSHNGWRNSGAAELGLSSKFSFSHLFGQSNFGIATSLTLNLYKYNTDILEDIFFIGDGQTGTEPDWKSEPWSAVGLYGGAVYVWAVSDKISIDIKMLAGAVRSKYPTTIWNTSSGKSSVEANDPQMSFAYAIEFVGRYSLTKKTGLIFSVDMFRTSPQFEVRFGSATSDVPMDITIQAVSLNVGVSRQF